MFLSANTCVMKQVYMQNLIWLYMAVYVLSRRGYSSLIDRLCEALYRHSLASNCLPWAVTVVGVQFMAACLCLCVVILEAKWLIGAN